MQKSDFDKDIQKDPRSRQLFIIAITVMIGSFVMPHDAVVATMATKYIFPAVIAGICFGIAIMTGIDIWAEVRAKENNKGAKSE